MLFVSIAALNCMSRIHDNLAKAWHVFLVVQLTAGPGVSATPNLVLQQGRLTVPVKYHVAHEATAKQTKLP